MATSRLSRLFVNVARYASFLVVRERKVIPKKLLFNGKFTVLVKQICLSSIITNLTDNKSNFEKLLA